MFGTLISLVMYLSYTFRISKNTTSIKFWILKIDHTNQILSSFEENASFWTFSTDSSYLSSILNLNCLRIRREMQWPSSFQDLTHGDFREGNVRSKVFSSANRAYYWIPVRNSCECLSRNNYQDWLMMKAEEEGIALYCLGRNAAGKVGFNIQTEYWHQI